ncbi:transmembrane protein 131-like [Coregonus clupeaformis]|uniref:transmembrane protein 131-like n=1 Tax=Coregonus clupeaformis TaxID=59861 RepID=UPI001E1C9ADE|nr:transmembrane protein 131-like [Coregonus clupeaformis]
MAGVREFQQGSHCHRKTWINILLGILPLLLPCVQHGGAQLQALSQMSSVVEVWQAEDADPVVPTKVEERSKDSLPLEERQVIGAVKQTPNHCARTDEGVGYKTVANGISQLPPSRILISELHSLHSVCELVLLYDRKNRQLCLFEGV